MLNSQSVLGNDVTSYAKHVEFSICFESCFSFYLYYWSMGGELETEHLV